MQKLLYTLADKLGIVTSFCDAGILKKEYKTNEKTIKFFVEKLGYKASTEKEIEDSLLRIEQKRWLRTLEPIYVRSQNNAYFDFVTGAEKEQEDFILKLRSQTTGKEIEPTYDVVFEKDSAEMFRKKYIKYKVEIKTSLEPDYYDIELCIGNEKYDSVLALSPEKCYENPEFEHNKLWGFAVQLYALRSKRNWGVGDFTDLAELADVCGHAGANIIGLNPLNVLMHDYPENASPYSSISRLFLNPIYIDVEKVPEFLPEDIKGLEKEIENCRNSEFIDYEKVYPLKIKVLEKIFKRVQKDPKSKYYKAYEKFCKENGKNLEMLALYQTIYHEQKDYVWGGNSSWPKELQNPRSKEASAYLKTKKSQVEFFKFLQFEADRQLLEAYNRIQKNDLKIGLYRDLPVGVGKDSAELWTDKDLFLQEAGAGAPPDAFFPTGQKWCLGAFNPTELKEQKYRPFINILRANMRYAGAIRIDHVMSLMRLYIIPDDMENGTYLLYDFDDMLGIVALESYLQKCVVVGESIGNVPDGFLEKIHEKNIYSLSVLWAERWAATGWFKNPEDYPEKAFASIGTHDMTPLKMWWFGHEIELYAALGMLKDEAEKTAAYKLREGDRRKLLDALDYNDVWPKDNLRRSDYMYGEGYPEGIVEAVEAFGAKSTSRVFLSQLEDVMEVDELQNLPGTDRDKHPNWRKKLPLNLEEYLKDRKFLRAIEAIKKYR